ncbi:MAG: hypothetical protein H0W72_12750 [Planctomycetes bacterium]|nr:hypothetical protein [Planctomycetota bacterium]
MKTLSITLATMTIAMCALSGCGTGQDRRAATSKATATVPADTNQANRDLKGIVASLKGLRDSDQRADLKKLHTGLQERAKTLKGSLADVASSSDAAVVAGKEQITQWHQQADTFTDPELRNASNKREGELRKAVDALSASNASLKALADPFEAQLAQTLGALDLDLSQPGLDSVKPVINALIDDAEALGSSLTEVSDQSKSLYAVINP